MPSRRLLVSATTNDALADQDIRTIPAPSVLNVAASCVTVTDTVGVRLDKTIIRDDSICNVRAAALGLVDWHADRIVEDELVGAGNLRVPVTVTTSAIIEVAHQPIPVS